MRILKSIFVFQTVAKNTVEAGMGEKQNASEDQPGDGQ
jgi:hypothetical protein